MLPNISISNKCCSFDLNSSKNHGGILVFTKKILSSTTVFNIENNNKKKMSRKSALLKFNSDRSCDTGDWINAENSALPSQE